MMSTWQFPCSEEVSSQEHRNEGHAAARPGAVDLPGGLVGSGAAAVSSQPPPWWET